MYKVYLKVIYRRRTVAVSALSSVECYETPLRSLVRAYVYPLPSMCNGWILCLISNRGSEYFLRLLYVTDFK
jgi:hypothetical protein